MNRMNKNEQIEQKWTESQNRGPASDNFEQNPSPASDNHLYSMRKYPPMRKYSPFNLGAGEILWWRHTQDFWIKNVKWVCHMTSDRDFWAKNVKYVCHMTSYTDFLSQKRHMTKPHDVRWIFQSTPMRKYPLQPQSKSAEGGYFLMAFYWCTSNYWSLCEMTLSKSNLSIFAPRVLWVRFKISHVMERSQN